MERIRGLIIVAAVAAGFAVVAAQPAPADGAQSELVDLSEHTVVIMFDDGWHSVFTDAYPLLKKHGMTAVLPLISGYVRPGQPRRSGDPYGYMNRAEVEEMIDSLGIEIASHTLTHAWLTRISDDSALREMSKSKQVLEREFLQEITTFVYPYGDYNNRIRALVPEAGYALARSIRSGTFSFSDKPYDVPASEVANGTPVAQVRRWITNNPVKVIFFHRIVPSPNYRTDWPTASFAQLLDWLDETGVQVMTLRDLYRVFQGRTPDNMLARPSWQNRVEWSLLEEIDADITRAAQ